MSPSLPSPLPPAPPLITEANLSLSALLLTLPPASSQPSRPQHADLTAGGAAAAARDFKAALEEHRGREGGGGPAEPLGAVVEQLGELLEGIAK